MGLETKILAFLLGLVFLALVLRNVKQNTFHPRYAVLWLGMSLFLLSIAALEPFYKWLATSVLGIQDARHIVYIALIGFLFIYNLYLTAMVSRMSNQILHLIKQPGYPRKPSGTSSSFGARHSGFYQSPTEPRWRARQAGPSAVGQARVAQAPRPRGPSGTKGARPCASVPHAAGQPALRELLLS